MKYTAEELYNGYRDKVLKYLLSRTDSSDDAADLCQDVFEQVFSSLHRYDETKASVSTWIYQITRFTLIDYMRTKHPGDQLPETFPSGNDPEAALINRETLQKLAESLASLEKEERDIIITHYFGGYSLTDISRITGISYGMVKVKHKKALKKIGEDLK